MALVYYPPIHVEGLHPAAGGLSQPSIFSFNPAAIHHGLLFSLFFAVADMIHFTAGGLLLAVLP